MKEFANLLTEMPVLRNRIATAALVADAAAMGLHWIYKDKVLEELATLGPLEFRTPDEKNYENEAGYFAHKGRKAGELSNYGENLLCTLNVCKELDGQYSVRRHQGRFLQKFGENGSFKGYLDHPTKKTIEALNQSATPPELSGSDDLQLPALCCVPALFSGLTNWDHLEEQVEIATRVTHNSAYAVSCSHFLSGFLLQILGNAADANVDDIMQRAKLEDSLVLKIRKACAFMGSSSEAADAIGRSCKLDEGLPLAMWILQNSKSFKDAIILNIRCGGDSCGRAMFVGPVAYAIWGEDPPLGLPQDWVEKSIFN